MGPCLAWQESEGALEASSTLRRMCFRRWAGNVCTQKGEVAFAQGVFGQFPATRGLFGMHKGWAQGANLHWLEPGNGLLAALQPAPSVTLLLRALSDALIARLKEILSCLHCAALLSQYL